MARFSKVVFTTDFSEASHHALPHAVEMCRRYEAELTILHCRTLFADDPRNLEYRFLDNQRLEEFLEQSLRDVSSRVEDDVPCHSAIVRNISPAAGILEYCDGNGIDLLVMGTHGRSAVGHFFLGSVAERVVRFAPCPVLTAGRPRGESEETLYRRVLVPFDFSRHSVTAARYALDVASRYGARVDVFYSVEQEVHPAFFDVWKKSMKPHLEEIRGNVLKELTNALGAEAMRQMHVEVGIEGERSDREIIRYASEREADLIVMGTHGLSGIDLALLGSTTERVIRKADCPVLTVKSESSGGSA